MKTPHLLQMKTPHLLQMKPPTLNPPTPLLLLGRLHDALEEDVRLHFERSAVGGEGGHRQRQAGEDGAGVELRMRDVKGEGRERGI